MVQVNFIQTYLLPKTLRRGVDKQIMRNCYFRLRLPLRQLWPEEEGQSPTLGAVL